MCPALDNSSETAPRLKPLQAVPTEQVADKCEPKLMTRSRHWPPVSARVAKPRGVSWGVCTASGRAN